MSWVGPAIQAGGSILGGAMGGKSSGGAPKWLKRGARQTFQFAQDLAKQPYQAYGGDRIAPFSPDTMAAMDLFRQRVGEDPYAPALANMQGLLNFQPQQIQTDYTAPQFAGQDMSPYMNPFLSGVVDTSLADIERARQMADSQMNAQAAAAGAFGGSRHGVANSLTNEGYAREAANTAAQLRYAGYTDAANRLENDLARQWMATELGQRSAFANQQAGLAANGQNLSAAGLYGNLIGAQQGQIGQDLARYLASGMMQDERAQNLLNTGYNDYLDQRNWGARQLGLMTSGLGAAAGALGGQPQPTGGGLLGALGGAQLGGQVSGSLYNLWGDIFGNPFNAQLANQQVQNAWAPFNFVAQQPQMSLPPWVTP